MELTLDQLKQYDCTDPSKPIYISVRGLVFDVSIEKSYYSPDSSYAMFVGKDASRALAKISTKDEDVIGSLDGLTDTEFSTLADWEKKSKLIKYQIIASLVA